MRKGVTVMARKRREEHRKGLGVGQGREELAFLPLQGEHRQEPHGDDQ